MTFHDANHARRVAILHATEDMGTVAFEGRCDGCDVDAALVDLAAGVLLWLESRERKRAAA